MLIASTIHRLRVWFVAGRSILGYHSILEIDPPSPCGSSVDVCIQCSHWTCIIKLLLVRLPKGKDPFWRESPIESSRGEKSGPRTILGPARTVLPEVNWLCARTDLLPELPGAKRLGKKHTDEASATYVPYHPAPVELHESESTRGDIVLSPE